MQTVGIRELKSGLSRYLSRVKSGERIIVTDRAKKIAIIAPFKKNSHDDKILMLMERGLIQWSGGKPEGISSRVTLKGKEVSKAVIEDRR